MLAILQTLLVLLHLLLLVTGSLICPYNRSVASLQRVQGKCTCSICAPSMCNFKGGKHMILKRIFYLKAELYNS